MQIFRITKGKTSAILPISIYDSSSTTGAKLAGLVFNSAGLTAYYNRSGAAGAAVAITLATATKGTWATGGFVAIDGTNMPGDYELHIPDLALATGADTVLVQLKGATNMVPKNILIELTAVDMQNATTAGLTNLDAAISSRMATYTQPTGFLAATFPTTVASTTNITAGTVTTTTNLTNLPAITANWLTAAGIAATALNGKGDWNIGKTGYSLTQAFPANFSALAITVTTGQVTVGTNADKTGYALTGTQTINITGNLSGSVGSVTGAVGSVTGAVGSVTGSVGSVTGAVGSVTGAVGSVTGLTAATVHSDLDDIQLRLPAALVGGKIDANASAIDGNATSAANLKQSTLGIVTATVGAASTTISVVTSSMSPAAAVADQFKGRIIVFKSDTTTANLRGQATDIIASSAAGILTVTALTTAPVSGDTFVVV